VSFIELKKVYYFVIRMFRCLKAKRVERPDYGQIVDEVFKIDLTFI
jgi:hypothetical protein